MSVYPVRNADGVIVATWDDDALLLTRFDIDEFGERVVRPGYPRAYTQDEADAAVVRLGYRLSPTSATMPLSEVAAAVPKLRTVIDGATALGQKAPGDIVPADVVALARGLAVVSRQVMRLTRLACRAVITTDPEADSSG